MLIGTSPQYLMRHAIIKTRSQQATSGRSGKLFFSSCDTPRNGLESKGSIIVGKHYMTHEATDSRAAYKHVALSRKCASSGRYRLPLRWLHSAFHQLHVG